MLVCVSVNVCVSKKGYIKMLSSHFLLFAYLHFLKMSTMDIYFNEKENAKKY